MSQRAPALSMADSNTSEERVAVVIITMNGRMRIARTLRNLSSLPEAPKIVVVDNGSSDGTAAMVESAFPQVRVLSLGENLGAAGRNAGVAFLDAPYIAFAEDDSWYEPGALKQAADILDAHPEVALINAQTFVGEDRRRDPLHYDMVASTVRDRQGLPGHRILSFLEGVSIVRRAAFVGVGGFDPRLRVGGPEEHLAADLLTAGWELRYVPDIHACHYPDHSEPSPRVRRLGLRNTLWFAWSRRPLVPALRWTIHVIRTSPLNRATVLGLADALRGLPRVLRERRPLPSSIEVDMALLDDAKMRSPARSYGRCSGAGQQRGWLHRRGGLAPRQTALAARAPFGERS
jgi:GT2 family glycosyltransferase